MKKFVFILAGILLSHSVVSASTNAINTNEIYVGTNLLVGGPPINPPLPIPRTAVRPTSLPPTPLWTYTITTNVPGIDGTNAPIWSEVQYDVDKAGNAAVVLGLYDSNTNYYGYNILWFSSKGQLQVNFGQATTNNPPIILSVDKSTLFVSDDSNTNSSGVPYGITKYSIKGNQTTAVQFGADVDGVLTSGVSKPPISSFGFVGRNTVNSFSCYLY